MTAERRTRLLIIDDSPEDRAIYRRMLDRVAPGAYDIAEAEAADEGLRQIGDLRPDCLLLDFRLPDMNGLEFLAELPGAEGDVAIVMLTGQGDEHVAAEAIKSGAQEYLSKNRLDPDMLHTAIQSALRLSRAQRELEVHRRQLERSNRDLERYARIVAHDLQAPLAGISTGLKGLLERSGGGEKLDPKSAEFVREAIESAARMAHLIRDILDYSRARADTTPFELVNMAQVAAAAAAALKVQVETSGASVITGQLPTVHGNAAQLTQLLQNLIGNAIKYRSAAPPIIHLNAERAGAAWKFAVRDNGVGIDLRHADRIFEPFIRLHASPDIEGTGVGLAICRAVVERHGGLIWLESEPGKGATFLFTLPVVPANQPADQAGQTASAPAAAPA